MSCPGKCHETEQYGGQETPGNHPDTAKAWARMALNAVVDAVLTVDPQGSITYMNRVAETLTGWTETEAIGTPLARGLPIVDGKSPQTTVNSGRRAIEENRAGGLSLGCALLSRDGSRFAIEDSAATIHDQDGRVTGAVIVFHDASIQEHVLRITLSISISLYPNDADDSDTLMHNAGMAMYHTKRNGRNEHQCFAAEMNTLPVQCRRIGPDQRQLSRPSQCSLDF